MSTALPSPVTITELYLAAILEELRALNARLQSPQIGVSIAPPEFSGETYLLSAGPEENTTVVRTVAQPAKGRRR